MATTQDWIEEIKATAEQKTLERLKQAEEEEKRSQAEDNQQPQAEKKKA